jgi:hypothetical protein
MKIVVHALGTDVTRRVTDAGLVDAGPDPTSFRREDNERSSKEWTTHWIFFDLCDDESFAEAQRLWSHCIRAQVRSCFAWFVSDEHSEAASLRAALLLIRLVERHRNEYEYESTYSQFAPVVLHCAEESSFDAVLHDLSDKTDTFTYEMQVFVNRVLHNRELLSHLSNNYMLTPLDRLWLELPGAANVPIGFRRITIGPDFRYPPENGATFTVEKVSIQAICRDLRNPVTGDRNLADELLKFMEPSSPILPSWALTQILTGWFATRFLRWFLGEDPWSWYAEPLEAFAPTVSGSHDLTAWFIGSFETAVASAIFDGDQQDLKWFVDLLDRPPVLAWATRDLLKPLINREGAASRMEQGIEILRSNHDQWQFTRDGDSIVDSYSGAVREALLQVQHMISAAVYPGQLFM